VVTPKGHPLIPNADNPKPVKFTEAAKYDIISLHEGGVIDDLISEAASKIKLDMHPHIKVVRFGSLRQMIAAGLGIGFLRKSSVAGYLGHIDIAGAPIADDWAKRQLLIAHEGDANLTSAARLFRDYLLKKSSETSFKPVLG
ncbi:MAG: LysR substrate-binding domain-containing protein, partial [Pseudomonadales bacterium]